MRILLDTHVLLWLFGTPERLGDETLDYLADRSNDILFSAVSIWEIAIKAGLGRADFKADPRRVLETAMAAGFVELPVTAAAALRVASLPHIHGDPFDRLLVAQAINEPAVLFTADARLTAYSPDLVQMV